MKNVLIAPLIMLLVCPLTFTNQKAGGNSILLPQEKHLRNIRQLTFGGKNAEAYFSFDGKKLIFQSTREGFQCDQIFIMNEDGSDVHLVSTGKGQTTCAYFFPEDNRILYSSTHPVNPDCPPARPREKRFIWPLYPYEIFTAKADASDLKQLTHSTAPKPLASGQGGSHRSGSTLSPRPETSASSVESLGPKGKLQTSGREVEGVTFTGSYNAEATVSKNGRIVFTSLRKGDLDIYTMKPDGSDVKRLTHQKGYDGGPFFSADGKMIVYRAYHPKDKKELEEYEENLSKRQVVGGRLELFVMRSDGSNQKQITDNGASNFCPFFHPNEKQIIFSSNLHQPEGREFNLHWINVDGTGLERITFHTGFDSFPMFSPDGKRLVFVSNRNAKQPGEFNIFLADWVP